MEHVLPRMIKEPGDRGVRWRARITGVVPHRRGHTRGGGDEKRGNERDGKIRYSLDPGQASKRVWGTRTVLSLSYSFWPIHFDTTCALRVATSLSQHPERLMSPWFLMADLHPGLKYGRIMCRVSFLHTCKFLSAGSIHRSVAS